MSAKRSGHSTMRPRRRAQVLLVEDDEDTREVLRLITRVGRDRRGGRK